MTSWLLIAWLCVSPGQCNWQIVGEFKAVEACERVSSTLSRYAECVKMTVPMPGSPR